MDSVHDQHSMMSSRDTSPQQTPQRLSNLYQYHNAPEVAPAHGLEYDDNVYPSSDKYPVIHSYTAAQLRRKSELDPSNKPPLIIFGMKLRTFLAVAAVVILVVIGAAVGGAVGGKNLSSNETVNGNFNINSTSSSTNPSTATATSTFYAATPTFTPLSDCPQSNSTLYTSTYASGTSGSVTSGTGLNFTKYCDISSPLSQSSAHTLAEAFVYTFSDCVEVCAGLNFWSGSSNCTVAVYVPAGTRPGNCWVGSATVNGGIKGLGVKTGTDVAVLT